MELKTRSIATDTFVFLIVTTVVIITFVECDNFFLELGICALLGLVAGFAHMLIYKHVLQDDLTLSAVGIERKNRLRTDVVRWDQVCQVVRADGNIYLLKQGGRKLENGKGFMFTCFNPGKLIAFKETQEAMDLLLGCYGPADMELKKE